MNHDMKTHALVILGGFAVLLIVGALFDINLTFLAPLLCMGMMVFMMIGMGHDDHHDHK